MYKARKTKEENAMWLYDSSVKRTRLCDRILPRYTPSEEVINTASHIAGILFGLFVLTFGLLSAIPLGAGAAISVAVYGVSMIMLYSMSSVYHLLPHSMGKKVFQVIDHCTIYFLIAGTYTPILTISLAPKYPVAAWVTFAVVWGLAVLEIVMNGIDLKKYEKISLIAYVAIGWAIIFSIDKAFLALGGAGFAFLLSGGIVYTVGAVLYAIGKHKKVKYIHSVFHFFVLGGTVLQAICVLFYVL